MDLLIARESTSLLDGVPCVLDPGLVDAHGNNSGDHLAVLASLDIQKPKRQRKLVTYRRFSSINLSKFKADVSKAKDCSQLDDVTAMVTQYNEACSEAVQKHAPPITKTITLRPGTAWYTNELRQAKRTRKKLERSWRKTGLAVHRSIYKSQCRVVGRLINEAKRIFYATKVRESHGCQKMLFRLFRGISCSKSRFCQSDDSCTVNTAEKFSHYFVKKVKDIRADLMKSVVGRPISDPMSSDLLFSGSSLTTLAPASTQELQAIICNMSSSSSILDPLPTSLFKHCQTELLFPLCAIINLGESCRKSG